MKILFLALGIVSLVIGVVGIILPVLPTTPFLLLTVTLFSKGSDRVRKWFMTTQIYQLYLKEFHETHTMTKSQKTKVSVISDVMIFWSIFMVEQIPLKVLLATIMLLKHFYFYKYIGTAE